MHYRRIFTATSTDESIGNLLCTRLRSGFRKKKSKKHKKEKKSKKEKSDGDAKAAAEFIEEEVVDAKSYEEIQSTVCLT